MLPVVCLSISLLLELSSAGQVRAIIDGRHITSARQLSTALGWFGVDLFNLGFHRTHRNTTPARIKIRSRDVMRWLPNSPVGYILQYGYLEAATGKSQRELVEGNYWITKTDLGEGLRELQEFHGLRVTGTPTVETQALMMRSRCGARDVDSLSQRRVEVYGSSKHVIRYWFNQDKMTEDLPEDEVKREIEGAMRIWAEAADVSFTEVDTPEDTDVSVSFETGNHGDDNLFYGSYGAHSHASLVEGIIHFDDAEIFTAHRSHGTNLKQAASHAIGHLLGIPHFNAANKDSLMYPIYKYNLDTPVLSAADRTAAVELMGPGPGTVTSLSRDISRDLVTSPTPPPPDPDSLNCVDRIDAALHMSLDGAEQILLFSGDWFYTMRARDPASGDRLPVLNKAMPARRIGIDGLYGLTKNLDATVQSLENLNQFYAFKRQRYFIYDMHLMAIHKRGPLSDLWPIETPERIEGAVMIDPQTLGFLVKDKLYEYRSNTQEWVVGCKGSNYFKKFRSADSLTVGFMGSWTWIFQGAVSFSQNIK